MAAGVRLLVGEEPRHARVAALSWVLPRGDSVEQLAVGDDLPIMIDTVFKARSSWTLSPLLSFPSKPLRGTGLRRLWLRLAKSRCGTTPSAVENSFANRSR
jgi:hypothetical protein